MAIRSQEELRTALNGFLGETPSDEGLTLLEDLEDTLTSLTSDGSAASWKQKYEDNDAAWRKRYRERFNGPVEGADGGENKNKNEDKPMTFEDLFKEVK